MSMTRISVLMMRPPRVRPNPVSLVSKASYVAPPSQIEIQVESPVLAPVEIPVEADPLVLAPDLTEVLLAPSNDPSANVVLTRALLEERTKATLVKFAAEIGLELDPNLKKADMVSRLAAALSL